MMKRVEWQRNMPDLTAKIMREHYKRNLDYVLSYMADDIVWIGPLESQFICGKDKVKEFLTPEQEIPVSISEMDFQLVSYNYNAAMCIVVGKLRARTQPETGLVLDVEQRYTFCWQKTGETPCIIHIHASNPWEFVSPEEKFPFRTGRYAYRIMERMVNRQQQKLVFYDTNKHEIFMEQKDIIYIESAKTNSRVYHTGGVFEVRHSISQMEHILPTEFFRVHRCYLINIYHVTEVKRFEISMDNMEQIPIPEKKYMEVRQHLEELLKKYVGSSKSVVPFEK